MSRYEIKYYISQSTAASLKSVFGALSEKDSHSGEDGFYAVTSTYFDDRYFSSYYEKTAGNDYRSRWRIRSYNGSDDFVSLERKSKKGDITAKLGKRISAETASELFSEGVRGLPLSQGKTLLSEFFAEAESKALIPVITVEYKRTAFALPVSDVRITVDENIRVCRYTAPFDRETPKILLPDDGLAVLEVKYGAALPDIARTVLSSYPADRCSISKYAMSMELFINS